MPPPPRRLAALALALALAGAAAAQPACPAGLSADQCKACALSANPAKCHACVSTAKASQEPGMVAATCLVCGSLPTAAQQDLCSSCVKTHGYSAGCSTCAGNALFGIAVNSKPTDKGMAAAAGCFDCYAKAGAELQVRVRAGPR
jgi:hypothetical protein